MCVALDGEGRAGVSIVLYEIPKVVFHSILSEKSQAKDNPHIFSHIQYICLVLFDIL